MDDLKNLEKSPPPWVALVRVQEDTETWISEAYAGPGTTPQQFAALFGVNLSEFHGYYIWTGPAEAPIGPVTPGPVRPIIVLRQVEDPFPTFRPHIVSFKKGGVFNPRTDMAWIPTDLWENVVGEIGEIGEGK